MTDLLTTIPSFPTTSYTHLLPSLEKNLISTADLLTLDALEVAKRAQLPILDVRRLASHVLEVLHNDLGFESQVGRETEAATERESSIPTRARPGYAGQELKTTGAVLPSRWKTISLLDGELDKAVGGGIPTAYVTEVTGESAVGKTQFLLTLLLSCQLPPPHGLSRSCIYISTESGLPTSRLTQLLSLHPMLSPLPNTSKPTLSRILAIRVHDLEEQDHILTYQLPVAIKRHNVGLVVIDSVAANFRAEHASHQAKAMASRSTALVKLGTLLRKLAREEGVAIVVANQVSDRFESSVGGNRVLDGLTTRSSSPGTSTSSPAPQPSQLVRGQSQTAATGLGDDLLSLDHQQKFFSGWGDEEHPMNTSLKTPALGLVWTNQIACRIALKMSAVGGGQVTSVADPISNFSHREKQQDVDVPDVPQEEESYLWNLRQKKRTMRVVFAPWVIGSKDSHYHGEGPEFEITEEGIRSMTKT